MAYSGAPYTKRERFDWDQVGIMCGKYIKENFHKLKEENKIKVVLKAYDKIKADKHDITGSLGLKGFVQSVILAAEQFEIEQENPKSITSDTDSQE